MAEPENVMNAWEMVTGVQVLRFSAQGVMAHLQKPVSTVMQQEIATSMKEPAISRIVWGHTFMPARLAMEVVHRLPARAVMEAESVRSAAEAVNNRIFIQRRDDK